jgi:predicted component of type VI protein secretion system
MPRDVKLDLIKPYIEDGMPEDYLDMHLGNLPMEMRTAVEDYLSNAGSEDMDIDMDIDMDGGMDLGDPYGDDLYESKKDKKQKITKSQLKETIRREILAALTEDSDLTEEEEEDITLDAETEDIPANDSEDVAPTSGGSVEEVQRDLTAALNSAKQLGDKKLVRQIGNALTYFTRQQISSEEM